MSDGDVRDGRGFVCVWWEVGRGEWGEGTGNLCDFLTEVTGAH